MGSWDTDTSSGFLTNFRAKVTDSYAATDPRYNEGKTTMAIWELDLIEVFQDWDGDLPEELRSSYPVGAGWSSEDGKVLEHERKRERFHASAIYGKLIDQFAGKIENYGPNASRTDGEELVVDLSEAMAVLEERGTPEDVSIWEGFTFDFAEVHFDYGTDKDGKPMGTNRTMPIAVVEVPGGAAPAKKAAKSAAKKATGAAKKTTTKAAPAAKSAVELAKEKREAAKAAAAKAESATSDEEADANDAVNPFADLVADEALAEQLAGILAESDSFDAFVNAIAEIEEVVTDDNGLFDALIDDTNGPWAVVNAGA